MRKSCHALEGTRGQVQPVLLGAALQVDVVRRRLGVAEHLAQGLVQGLVAGRRPDRRRAPPGRSARRVEREQRRGRRARRWRRGRGSRGRCRRRAAPGRTPPAPAAAMTSRTSPTATSTAVVGEQGRAVRDRAVAQPPDQRGLDLGDDHAAYALVGQHLRQREARGRARRPAPRAGGRGGPAPRAPAPARCSSPGCPSRTPRWPAAPASVLPSASVRCRSTSSPRSDSARATSTPPSSPTLRRTSYELVAMATTSYDVVCRTVVATGTPSKHGATRGSGHARPVTLTDAERAAHDVPPSQARRGLERPSCTPSGSRVAQVRAHVRARRWRRVGSQCLASPPGR